LLDRLGCSVRPGCGLSVDVGLRPGLSSSESLHKRLGVIDDLGRHPDASGWHHLDRCNDLGNLLDVGHGLGNGFVHGDCGWDGFGINLGLGGRHCDSLIRPPIPSVAISPISAVVVVDVNNSSITTVIRIPRLLSTGSIRLLLITISTVQAFISSSLI
jgi:hypothetical protein